MENLVKLLLVLFMSTGIPVFAQQRHALRNFNYKAAGVLPYMDLKLPGRKLHRYYLFAKDSHGKYSDFGGYKHQRERHPVETAARELQEESMGLFFPDVKKAIQYISVSKQQRPTKTSNKLLINV